MKTASIKIKRGIANAQVVSRGDLERKLLKILLFSLAALAFFYVFLLGRMVFNIVERESLNSQARALQNDVSQLELTYLSDSGKVDLDYSHTLGFQEVSPEYATRQSLGSIQTVKNEI